MLPLVEQHRSAISALCRKYHINRLELFGSGAREDFDPISSDLDFLVEFEDMGWKGSFRRYMGLKLDLERLFARNVDLVELTAIDNPYFLQVAKKHRALVYAA